jgi:hypothetical protein
MCKYLFLQYSVTNQKHNSCKIYLKIIQVVSKGRKISWLAGGVIGYDSERGPHKDHSTKVWSQLAKLVSEEKILNDFAFDLTQNIAKPNIYTCCSSSNICICCSLCGFYRVEYCIATSGLVV